MRSTAPRTGFTLIELLVVIVIIAILISLMLPAINAARETANMTACTSNIRNLGIALLAYHTQHKMMSFSISPWQEGDTNRRTAQLNGKGWVVGILPNIEQKNMFDQFNFKGDFFSSGGMMATVNRTLAKSSIPVLLCPSDPDSKDGSTGFAQWSGVQVAGMNYKGCIGDTRMGGASSAFQGTEPDCHNNWQCNGMFWRNSYQWPNRYDECPDGLPQTFLVGEDIPKYNIHSAWLYANGDYASCHIPLNYLPDPINAGDWPNRISFRSYHPAGANFVFADGHTQFISERIDTYVYRSLGTRDGKLHNKNERPLSAGDY